ncbi:MAG: MFS transporter [Anaerolineales bacterium]
MTPKRRVHYPALSIARALRHPNYRLWFAGQSVSLIGTWMQSVAQQWVVYEMTGSKFLLGAVAFAGSLPTFFLMLPAGVLADRVPRRSILLYTQTASMVLAFLLMTLLAAGRLEVWHVFVMAALLGVVNSVDAPARQSFTIEIIEERGDLPNAIALNATMFNLARVIGPAAAGLILATWGAVWCFGVNGASFIAVLAGLLLMRIPPAIPAATEEPFRQVRDGVRYAVGHKVILPLILITVASGLFSFSYSTLLPAFAVEVLHQGETALGLLNAAVGVGAVLGSLFMASRAHLETRAGRLMLGSLLFPLSLLVFSFSGSYALSMALLVITGFGLVVQNTSINSIIQTLVDDRLRGRVMSIYLLAFFGAVPLGALQAGIVAQVMGPVAGLALSAGLGLLLAVVIYAAHPSLRRI